LLQSLRSDNFSGAQLSRTIESDVVLLAAVIRMANTAYIGTSTRVTSVEHAVLLIGQEGLRHLITSVAFRPIIDLNSGHYTHTLAPRIWDQSE
ncbi:HDOD domain-containing protein, partial [Escherichia coli]|uniref:HDOD domain-containing protein n=1 Tax=Escherichia coli TaxID=562 RepID=UPI002283C9B8